MFVGTGRRRCARSAISGYGCSFRPTGEILCERVRRAASWWMASETALDRLDEAARHIHVLLDAHPDELRRHRVRGRNPVSLRQGATATNAPSANDPLIGYLFRCLTDHGGLVLGSGGTAQGWDGSQTDRSLAANAPLQPGAVWFRLFRIEWVVKA